MDGHPPFANQPVGDLARVAAMNVARASAAVGTPGRGRPEPGLDDQRLGQDLGAHDPHTSEVRE